MCLRLPLKNVIIPWSECHIDVLPCWLGEDRLIWFLTDTQKLSRLFSLCLTKINDCAIHTCISHPPLALLRIIFSAHHNWVPCPSVVRGSLVTVSPRALDTRLSANQRWVWWALANERTGQSTVHPQGKADNNGDAESWHLTSPTMPGLMRPRMRRSLVTRSVISGPGHVTAATLWRVTHNIRNFEETVTLRRAPQTM